MKDPVAGEVSVVLSEKGAKRQTTEVHLRELGLRLLSWDDEYVVAIIGVPIGEEESWCKKLRRFKWVLDATPNYTYTRFEFDSSGNGLTSDIGY